MPRFSEVVSVPVPRILTIIGSGARNGSTSEARTFTDWPNPEFCINTHKWPPARLTADGECHSDILTMDICQGCPPPDQAVQQRSENATRRTGEVERFDQRRGNHIDRRVGKVSNHRT
jgi:hypothetical protein